MSDKLHVIEQAELDCSYGDAKTFLKVWKRAGYDGRIAMRAVKWVSLPLNPNVFLPLSLNTMLQNRFELDLRTHPCVDASAYMCDDDRLGY